MLDYIRSSFEILSDLKKGGAGVRLDSQRGDDPQKDYEQMLQNLEEEARNHIRIEQQLKLHIDNLQEKIEEKEKLETRYKHEIQEKAELNNMLKEKLKEYVGKYNKLKQALKIDNSRSKPNISTEEIIKKPYINDSTKKVILNTL